MRILQIWMNDYMPKEIKRYIKTVKDNTAGDYYFIGNPDNSPDGAIVLDHVGEVNKAQSYLGNQDWWNKYCTHPMFVSDMIRVAWAMQYSDLLYADCDCELLSNIQIIDNGKPYLPIYQHGLEFFIFYSGNTDWWKTMVAETIQRKPFIDMAIIKTLRDMYWNRGKMKDINILDEKSYKHMFLHGGE